MDTYNPVRAGITNLANTSGSSWFANAVDDRPFSASTPYPARYTNRDGTSQREFSLDGDYYVRVNADRHEKEPSSTTFLITVVVSGDVEAGPVYQVAGADVTATATGSASTSVLPATSPAASATSSPATPSATPPAGTSASSDLAALTGQSAPTSEPAVPGWVWAAVAVVAAAAVAAFLLVRSRRRTTDAAGPDGTDQPGSRHW